MKIPVDKDRSYLASEIASMGLIPSKLGNRGAMVYRSIRRYIQFGKLKAEAHYGKRGIYYTVKGSDIIEFLKTHQQDSKKK